MVDDLIIGTFASGSSTTGVHTMLRKEDDYYNEQRYRCYIYEGTNIGEEREVSDWVNSSNTLTLGPAFTSAIDSTSKYELHHRFMEGEYRRAINLAIDALAKRYLLDIKDETTIKLTSTEDNEGNTVYTWEYALPTDMLYIYRIITEEAVAGTKLTGTVSGDFTAGETITGGTSGATGELSYGVSGGTYIRVRKVDGTFVTGETATGGTSNETCSSITAVESETAGGGRWLDKDIIDPRDYKIIRSYPPKLKLDESQYNINEDLYLRIEGQGAQPRVTSDTGVIYLPPDWVVQKAITFLPYTKILSNELEDTFRRAERASREEPRAWPHPEAVAVIE